MKAELVKRKDRWDLYGAGGAKIASSLDWNTKLSIKNCQAIERGYDLDELAENWVFTLNGHKWSNNDNTAGDNYGSFMAGAKTILAIFMDKKFTEEDMRNAFISGSNVFIEEGTDDAFGSEFQKEEDDFIQSLQQTEWDVELVQEKGKDTFGNAELTWYNSKLDADGCLILKRAE